MAKRGGTQRVFCEAVFLQPHLVKDEPNYDKVEKGLHSAVMAGDG